MSKFQVGQKVVVNSNTCWPLIQGQKYTVERVDDESDLIFIQRGSGCEGYFSYRFNAAPEEVAEVVDAPLLVELSRVGEAVKLTISGKLSEAQAAAILKAAYA